MSTATGAHPITCTRAIVESGGNLHAALAWLRKRGYSFHDENLAGLENLVLAQTGFEQRAQEVRPSIRWDLSATGQVRVKEHYRAAPRRK
jgi:hypothetical protein